MNSRLGTDFKSNVTARSLGVIDSLGTSLNILADAVVVAGAEDAAVAETVQGHSIFRCTVANRGGIASDGTLLHVEGRFTTNQEAVATDHTISSDSGSLDCNDQMREKS